MRDPWVVLFDCIPSGRGDDPAASFAACVASYRHHLDDCERYCRLDDGNAVTR
ncbi:MAG: hypothetical protein M3457_22565 [Chloroflexota bacterium]|nr:hypothetical protein [Chloroflexota bacterium]